jgi:hypothetical protein
LRPVLSQDQDVAARRPPPRRSPLMMNDPSAETASPFQARPTAQAPIPFNQPASRQPARVGGDDAQVRTVRRDEPKVGRNDPCPCGSGKKYKKCHGAAA